MNRRRFSAARCHSAGFTLIEVMIAILVLGIGLLGFALLQTMSVRFSQSANYRTQATNLTYEMLDQMRANRILASAYVGDYEADTDDCEPAMGSNLTATAFTQSFECRLGKALGEDATGSVVRNGNEVTVSITWGDDRWVENADARTFSATTQL